MGKLQKSERPELVNALRSKLWKPASRYWSSVANSASRGSEAIFSAMWTNEVAGDFPKGPFFPLADSVSSESHLSIDLQLVEINNHN